MMNLQPSIAGDAVRAQTGDRPPPKQVLCLLPLWGFDYVKTFLDVALPTWLAEGNLPAVSGLVPTEFVFLTSREDEIYLRAHPGFDRLSAVCPTTVRYIDHLITGTNYSTTITLSYLEAMRATGADMRDTCFLLLVSDYIVADGSFRTVAERVMAGRDAILVGNFQVVEEDALPWLADLLQAHPAVLPVAPRQLMKWALSHLHPATVANTVNYPLIHNDHTNRLFWRVDSQTLIGRFYLMHMIAVRPEVDDFVIGSSCDYSFVPEMCPGNNVEIVTDSDDYLVIELQPRKHEAKFLQTGPLQIDALAGSLSEWTNARHRENSASTVVFHADEIPPSIGGAIGEADRFVGEVAAKLKQPPKPVRQHPYWTGAMAAFNEASGATLTRDEWRRALGLPSPDIDNAWLAHWITENIRFALFGQPPHVRLWHPRQPDYALVTRTLAQFALDQPGSLLMVAGRPTIFTATFADGGYRAVRLNIAPMLKQPPDVYEPLHGRFEVCLLEIGELDLPKADEILDRIAPLMREGGTVLVSLTNGRDGDPTRGFQRAIGLNASRLLQPYVRSQSFSFVTSNRLREFALKWVMRLARLAYRNPTVGMPALSVFGGPLAAICGIGNRLAGVALDVPPASHVSSALIRLTIDAERAREAYQYSNGRILRSRKLAALGLPMDHRLPRRDDIGRAPKVEYLLAGGNPADVITPSRDVGEPWASKVPVLPGFANHLPGEDDPQRLAFLLARYEFVAKMLSGRKSVAEVGGSDAFGTRIVMQSTGNVIAYDANPMNVEAIRRRRSERWPIVAHVHDILEAPLPDLHDGIFSLDLIGRIPRTAEQRYLDHLRDSLVNKGVLVIGSPSLSARTDDAPSGGEGRGDDKSGGELKALLENYFEHVLLFSMSEGVLHAGITPAAHYLFIVCCQKKQRKLDPWDEPEDRGRSNRHRADDPDAPLRIENDVGKPERAR
jgi:hypothetical protein